MGVCAGRNGVDGAAGILRICGGVAGFDWQLEFWAGMDGFAGVGVLVGVAYTWRALQKAFFSDKTAHAEEIHHQYAPITLPEWAGVGMLLAVTLAVGLWPRLILDSIEPAVKAMLAGGGL